MTVIPASEPAALHSSHESAPCREPISFTARLLREDGGASWLVLVQRLAVGLGLSAIYGLALGARQGGRALLEHAVGVPLGLGLVAVVGGPSVFVFLSMCRAPIDARGIAESAVRAVGSAGILLAGLAPAAALFVVSSETAGAAAGAVSVGLLLGGGVALGRMLWSVVERGFQGAPTSVLGGLAVAAGFGVFAVALAARVWAALLPILGGAS